MESLAYLYVALNYEAPEPELNLKALPCLRSSSTFALQLLVASVFVGLSSSASYANSLQRGMSGPEVMALQEKLQALGYFEPCPTGYFGEATQEAAQRFQRDRGLTADGVVGSQTQSALASNSTAQRSPQASPSSSVFDTSSFTTPTATSSPTPQAQNFDSPSFTPQTPTPQAQNFESPSFTRQTPTPTPTFDSRPSTPPAQSSTFDTRPFTGSTETPQAVETPSTAPSRRVSDAPTSGRMLRLGDRAPEVGTLQNALRQAGFYHGETSGYFDAATEEAVIYFQQASGLSADGIIGPQTRSLLLSQSTPSTSTPATSTSRSILRHGESGEGVTHLQQALTAAGFYDGPITGYFGSLTEAALLDFQQAKGINADGIAGPATQSALMNYSSSASAASYSAGRNFYDEFSVLQLQERLQARGLYGGSLDGIDGPMTQAAVEAATQRYLVSESEIRNGRF